MAPLQSITHASPRSRPAVRTANATFAPSEVCSPSASCQPRGATYPRWFPNHRLRCALRVSHPLDALLPARPAGFVSSQFRSWGLPFEALFPAWRRTPSRAPHPSWGSLDQIGRASPPGSCTSSRARTTGLGFSQDTVPVPPWAFPPPGFLVFDGSAPLPRRSLPSRTFSARPHADLAAGAPGSPPSKAQPFSLEIDTTPMRFCTSSALSMVWVPRRAGLSFSLGGLDASPQLQPLLHPTSGSRPESIETTVSVTARSDSRRLSRCPLRRFECCTSWPRSVTEARLLS